MTAENGEFNFERASALMWVAKVEDVELIPGRKMIADHRLIFDYRNGATLVWMEKIRIEIHPEIGVHTDNVVVDYPLGRTETAVVGSAIIAAAEPDRLRLALNNQPDLLRRFGLLEKNRPLDPKDTVATT